MDIGNHWIAMSKSNMSYIGRELLKLESDAKHIRRLSFIMNTVLGNACYSDKEKDAQISKAEKVGNLDDEELDLLNVGWDLRTKLARSLMTDLKVLINQYNKVDGI